MGRCHTHGWDGFPVDAPRALEWFLRAAAQGHPDGQFNLAVLFEIGEGVDEDRDEAYKLYTAAAAQGHEGARRHLRPRP